MTGKIFLSYRRGDDPGNTGRLFDRLEPEFGAENIFMDVEGGIKGGDDFADKIQEQLELCDVLLVVIGPRWLRITDKNGRRRLDNTNDWVRIEVVGALETDKCVIPVLVGGAARLREEDLPEPMRRLARREPIQISLEKFKSDAQGLIVRIRTTLAEIELDKTAADPASTGQFTTPLKAALNAYWHHSSKLHEERLAISRKRIEDDAAAAVAAEADDWMIANSGTDVSDFEHFLAMWPDGAHAALAQERIDALYASRASNRLYSGRDWIGLFFFVFLDVIDGGILIRESERVLLLQFGATSCC